LRSPVTAESAESADLGLWNVYGNPDLPGPQPAIERKLNPEGRLNPDEVLRLAMGRFKTPTVRALGLSAPYLHSGRLHELEDVLNFYRKMSDLAREGKMRNAPREFHSMRLQADDIAPLAAFLRALNEDYEEPVDRNTSEPVK
jgi:cytochrome c peroxidase